MKKYKVLAILLCVTLAAVSFGCGRQRQESESSTDGAVPTGITERQTGEYNIKNSLEEMTRLEASKENRIAASGQEELDSALADKTSSGVLLRTSERTTVTVKGSHAGKTVTVNAPSGCVISESENVSFVLEQTGTGGLITDAKASSVYVKGENIPLTLKAGADAVYINGKNCTATFKDGEYPSVTVLNATAVLTNLTQNDIKITLANGSTVTLPPQRTYSLADDSFSKAKP